MCSLCLLSLKITCASHPIKAYAFLNLRMMKNAAVAIPATPTPIPVPTADEVTNDNFAKLCDQLRINFSKERLEKIKEIGRKLYPGNK